MVVMAIPIFWTAAGICLWVAARAVTDGFGHPGLQLWMVVLWSIVLGVLTATLAVGYSRFFHYVIDWAEAYGVFLSLIVAGVLALGIVATVSSSGEGVRCGGWVESLGLLAILGGMLSGCAFEQPIDNRSMIYAIAIGAAPHHRYHVTIEQLNPLSLVTSTVRAPSGSTGPNVIFFSDTSSTVAGAFPHMLANSPGPLDLTNMGVVVFSHVQSQRDISSIMPFFLEGGHIRLLA